MGDGEQVLHQPVFRRERRVVVAVHDDRDRAVPGQYVVSQYVVVSTYTFSCIGTRICKLSLASYRSLLGVF
jgi:hypothetical protein